MDALPNTTAGPPVVAVAPPTLTRRMEAYARCAAAGMSYAEAFRQAGCVASTAGSQSRQISQLNRHPMVVARIMELRAKADQETVSTISERMAWLRLIISADPRELSRVVYRPCDLCWTDSAVAAAYGAHFAPSPFHRERPELPDTDNPRDSCPHCEGIGIGRVVITPTDELSPAGRALFKGAKQNEKGVIEIQMHDQVAAAEMLNKLQSAYVQRSLNMNINAAVHAAREVRPEELSALLASFDT